MESRKRPRELVLGFNTLTPLIWTQILGAVVAFDNYSPVFTDTEERSPNQRPGHLDGGGSEECFLPLMYACSEDIHFEFPSILFYHRASLKLKIPLEYSGTRENQTKFKMRDEESLQ